MPQNPAGCNEGPTGTGEQTCPSGEAGSPCDFNDPASCPAVNVVECGSTYPGTVGTCTYYNRCNDEGGGGGYGPNQCWTVSAMLDGCYDPGTPP
jgi:hypothetical protein